MSKDTSRLLSAVLRHKPDILGIELDKNGWVNVLELLFKLYHKKGISLLMKDLVEIVDTNDKKRFEFNEDKTKIRASQGHSLKVDLKLKNEQPPRVLYHGTVEKSINSILKDGLKKMNRHAVHLSDNIETATNVGSRRGDAIILEIQSARMFIEGYKFQKSANGVWLTELVLPKYIRINKE